MLTLKTYRGAKEWGGGGEGRGEGGDGLTYLGEESLKDPARVRQDRHAQEPIASRGAAAQNLKESHRISQRIISKILKESFQRISKNLKEFQRISKNLKEFH